MALKISPSSLMEDMVLGEDCVFRLNLNNELDGNTVLSHTYRIYNKNGSEEVTDVFSGGSMEADGYITFGLIAYAVGVYRIRFWIICNELLPDTITKVEFSVSLTVSIKLIGA